MNDIVQTWLDRYRRVGIHDPEDIRASFTEDATYAGGPFDPEPWIGREGIVEGWLAHRDEPGTWSFEGAPLAYQTAPASCRPNEYAEGRVYAMLLGDHVRRGRTCTHLRRVVHGARSGAGG